MATEQFGKHERRVVICEVEKYFGVKLGGKVEGRDIWRQDKSGKDWCILGGSTSWYAIPKSMMDTEQIEGGMIVLACMDSTAINIFSGSISQFVKNKCRLPLSEKGDYHNFNIRISGTKLLIKELPNAELTRFATITRSTP